MRGFWGFRASAALVLIASIAGASPGSGPVTPVEAGDPPHSPDMVLVRFEPGSPASARAVARSAVRADLDYSYTIVPGLERVRVRPGRTVQQTIDALLRNPNVLYAEPDYLVRAGVVPNDPSYSSLWGMQNIKAPQAWDITTGRPEVVVAVLDSGIDREHPDLQANLWVNPGEIPDNGIDDDGNGYIDDVYGWNFGANNNDPSDGNGHGTHVAGTIGAVGNNGVGVVGVAWSVRIASLKFLGASGSGSTSHAIQALEYARRMGFPISNNSWGFGGPTHSLSLYDAIHALQADGHLFVAAAGNDGFNSDNSPHYPASYNLPNIISVASITSSDQRSSFSNYGPTRVDIGAPGSGILSTTPGNSYSTFSGTSMAAPHVAGAAALLLSENPEWGYGQLREILFSTARPIEALSGWTVTGGTLDVHAALIAPADFPEFELSPQSLNFGDLLVGRSSAPQIVTLTNVGSKSLTISSVSIVSSEWGQFQVTSNCGTQVAAGASCTLSVVFSPQWAGLKNAILEVAGESGAGSKKVPLTGKAVVPEFSLTPTSLSFGSLAVGGSTAAKTVTLSNIGTVDLPILWIGPSGWGNFTSTDNCPEILAAGASCTVSVVFTPQYGGDISDTLMVYGGDGAGQKSVALSGIGIVPEYSLAPEVLDFGAVPVGQSSAARTVTLTNTGTLPLPISWIGTWYGQHSVTHDCATNVDIGAACTITLVFQPTYGGSNDDYLYVQAGGGAGSKSVTLSGTAIVPEYSLSVDSLEFGVHAVGTSSASQTLTLTNTGSLPLPLQSIGAWNYQFNITHDCGASVAVGASCVIGVKFVPQYGGEVTEYLYVFAENGAENKWITLSGTGLVPTFSLSVESLQFGDQVLGSASAPRNVVLTNTGSLVLPIDSIGSSLYNFSASHNCGASVATGSSCSISVTFGPQYSGDLSEYLYVYVGGGAQLQYVSLAGRGVTEAAGQQPGPLVVPAASSVGSYVVSWGASATPGVTYTLEEATSPSFNSGLRVAYHGPNLSAPVTGRAGGLTYYYRVRTQLPDFTVSSWVTAPNGCAVTLSPATAVTLTPSVASPAAVGTTVTFTAAASGGSGSYEYKYLLRLPGGALNVIRDYATQATWNWNTAGLNAGTYQVVVHARSVGSTKSYETFQSLSYALASPATAVTLTPSAASPAAVGTTVTFTAAASGGSGSYEYKYLLRLPGGALNVIRDYATQATWNWNTAGLNAGTYQVVVHARSVGSTKSYETFQSLSYALASPATAVTLTPSVASPAAVGAAVMFTAAASGGSGSYEYKYLLRLPGGALNVIRDYATQATWNWNTAGLNAGTYQVVVHARSVGSTKSYETFQSLSYALASPATAVTLTPSAASPAAVGTTVTFTAAASGGSGSYEYKYLLRLPGGALNVIRDYATQATWSWNTAGLSAGTYQVVVHARSVGSTKSYETFQSLSYVLASPATAVTLTPSVASPAAVGATVVFTAAASGGSGSYEYKYLLRLPGGALNVIRDYATQATWSWNTAGLNAGTYQVVVHARSVGSTKSYETFQSLSYVLSP
jgi:subtilisin family serine protease